MKYFIYKITNNINGKFIFGIKTNIKLTFKFSIVRNKLFREEFIKYGKENFKREIVKEFPSKEETTEHFYELKKIFINSPLCYLKTPKLSDKGKQNKINGVKLQAQRKFTNFKGIIEIHNRYFFKISNYCNHGEFLIRKVLFNKLYKTSNPIYCPKCREEYREKDSYKDLKCLDSAKKYEPKWISIFYPGLYHNILKIKYGSSFKEKFYLYKNKLDKPPTCLCCEAPVKFTSKRRYNTYCDDHIVNLRISKGETELYEFIKSILPNCEILRNSKFGNKELDIYIPSYKIAFEFNGLYWHSDAWKKPNFHLNKKNYFESKGIKLFFIWEDEWNFKRSIVESIIKDKFNLLDKVSSESMVIYEPDMDEVSKFLIENSLEGNVNEGTVNLGLKYKDELISLICLKKSKNWELVSYYNKINLRIEGGINKLFLYFIEEVKPKKVILKLNRDLTNERIPEELGFKFISFSKPEMWFTDNHHRNKISGINKIYNSGSSKWVLNN